MNYLMNLLKKKEHSQLKPMGVRTVNAHFLNIPKDDKFVRELSQARQSVEGILTSTDIIKDTFKNKDYVV